MSAARAPEWSLGRRRGPATTLHDDWPEPSAQGSRAVSVCELGGASAVVLGSTQHDDEVDRRRAAEAGVDVVRRRSGGGAVLVSPNGQAWFDLWLPRDDPLWDDDVVRAGRWLGETWARALGSLGTVGLEVHDGRAECTSWSASVCFGGVGPGEVTRATRKVVGISQRRTRAGARWQTSAPLSWDPAPLVALFGWDETRAERARQELAGAAVGLRVVLPAAGRHVADENVLGQVERAFLAALPGGAGETGSEDSATVESGTEEKGASAPS